MILLILQNSNYKYKKTMNNNKLDLIIIIGIII